MAFNLATFEQLLTVVEGAAQAGGAVVAEYGSGDHVGAVSSAVQTAGAIASASTTDTAKQAEIAGSVQAVTSLLPTIFAFASLFAKKPAASAAPAAK